MRSFFYIVDWNRLVKSDYLDEMGYNQYFILTLSDLLLISAGHELHEQTGRKRVRGLQQRHVSPAQIHLADKTHWCFIDLFYTVIHLNIKSLSFVSQFEFYITRAESWCFSAWPSFQSERESGDRNFAIGYYLKEKKVSSFSATSFFNLVFACLWFPLYLLCTNYDLPLSFKAMKVIHRRVGDRLTVLLFFQCFPEGTDMTSILDFYFQVNGAQKKVEMFKFVADWWIYFRYLDDSHP